MVVPFAATAAWLWRMSHPYHRDLLDLQVVQRCVRVRIML
jgi:hypothetical protein